MGCDFNRNPMCAVVAQLQGDRLVVLKEWAMTDADTKMLATSIRDDFPRQEIYAFPDPTGSRQQTSSMGLSDHAILRQHGFKVKSPKRLIRSLASLEYAPGKSVADPRSEHGHATDALGYLCLGVAKGLLPYSIGQSTFRMY